MSHTFRKTTTLAALHVLMEVPGYQVLLMDDKYFAFNTEGAVAAQIARDFLCTAHVAFTTLVEGPRLWFFNVPVQDLMLPIDIDSSLHY